MNGLFCTSQAGSTVLLKLFGRDNFLIINPLTVEPQKPRLCIDARFLNLWMADTPFSLDTLAMVPRFVYRGSFMTKIDDKSGYDHILLSEDSHQFFGIEWQGWWLVRVTLPFGWKNSPNVYQTVGLGPTNFFRGRGIVCSLYIDDRLNGKLFTSEGYWSRPISQRNQTGNLAFRLRKPLCSLLLKFSSIWAISLP